MGIKYNCPKCGREISYPDTLDFDTQKSDQIAHMIYSIAANEKKPCYDCNKKI